MGFKRITFPFEVDERKVGGSKWDFLKLAKLSVNTFIGFFTPADARHKSYFSSFFVLAIKRLFDISAVKRRLVSDSHPSQLLIGSIVMISLGLLGL